MNCTNKQQETAECEKRGCEGCAYNDEAKEKKKNNRNICYRKRRR